MLIQQKDADRDEWHATEAQHIDTHVYSSRLFFFSRFKFIWFEANEMLGNWNISYRISLLFRPN